MPWNIGNIFALFILADTDERARSTRSRRQHKRWLNEILREAHDGEGAWHFWVADKNYKDLPDEEAQEGSQAPFDEDGRWQPPEIESMEDAADFVRSLPRGGNAKGGRVMVDQHHFAVVDDRFRKKGWLMLYRRGDSNHEGEEITSFPITPSGATVYLVGQKQEHWDQTVELWERKGIAAER